MNSEKRKKTSLLFLWLSAVAFGLVTLAEIGAAVYFIVQTHLLYVLKIAIQGMAQGSNAVAFGAVGKPDALEILRLVLFVLPPILTVVTLILLYKRKKREAR